MIKRVVLAKWATTDRFPSFRGQHRKKCKHVRLSKLQSYVNTVGAANDQTFFHSSHLGEK